MLRCFCRWRRGGALSGCVALSPRGTAPALPRGPVGVTLSHSTQHDAHAHTPASLRGADGPWAPGHPVTLQTQGAGGSPHPLVLPASPGGFQAAPH